MTAIDLKAWLDTLPDDTYISILASRYYSFSVKDPVFMAVDPKEPGKVISSLVVGDL
jgi:hypothetical protein